MYFHYIHLISGNLKQRWWETHLPLCQRCSNTDSLTPNCLQFYCLPFKKYPQSYLFSELSGRCIIFINRIISCISLLMHFSYEPPTNQVSDSAFGTVVRKTRSSNDVFCIKRGLVYSCYLRMKKKKKSHNVNTKPFIKRVNQVQPNHLVIAVTLSYPVETRDLKAMEPEAELRCVTSTHSSFFPWGMSKGSHSWVVAIKTAKQAGQQLWED